MEHGRVDRRTFLTGLAAAVGVAVGCSDPRRDVAPLATTTTARASNAVPPTIDGDAPTSIGEGPATAPAWAPRPAEEPFALGVASGDPRPGGITLWTRLTCDPTSCAPPASTKGAGGGPPGGGDVEISWQLARDPELGDVVAEGRVRTGTASAGAVHVDVDGLDEVGTLFYGFAAADGARRSIVGRTRLPDPARDEAIVAVASCQRFQDGPFTVHRELAGRDLDAVVMLGDTIYAGGGGGGWRPFDEPAPDDLDGYRRRHARALGDVDLAACRAAHPWIATRDDNDVANGWGPDHPARDIAERAFLEHHPVRGGLEPRTDLHRLVSLGGGCDVVLLDVRPHRSPRAGAPALLGARRATPEMDEAARTMLGPVREDDLRRQLEGSSARWQLVASQVMVGDLTVALGDTVVLNDDQWDGYPAARGRLDDALAKAPSPLVVSGDLHSGVIDQLRDGSGEAVAVELVTPSVTTTVTSATRAALAAVALSSEDLLVVLADRRGWVELDLGPDQAIGQLHVLIDALDVTTGTEVRATVVVPRGARRPSSVTTG